MEIFENSVPDPDLGYTYCICTAAKKPPLGWTYDPETGRYVCSECRKPSKAELERSCENTYS